MKYFKIFFLALIIVTFSLGGCSKNENMKTNKIEKEELVVEEDCLPRESTDFAFVIDGSGSMLKNDKEKLRISKAEVIVHSMKEKDRATVVAFDKQAEVLINGITTNQGDIISALNQVPSDGELTDISSGIELASNSVKNLF